MAVIDLHLHPRMDLAVPIFSGYPTESPASAASERAILDNALCLADFARADVRLIAATCYALPVLSQLRGGYLAELRGQLRATKDWAQAHGLEVVASPDQAEAVLRSPRHRLGVLLAVEGTHGVVSEEGLDALREEGVRMLTISHLKDSPWAGAAAVRYWPFSDGNPYGPEIARRNRLGLTELGRRLLGRAVDKGFLIDLTHCSDRSVEEAFALHPRRPFLFTHQSAREITPNERSISSAQLRRLAESGGMTGLFFSSQFMGPGIEDLVRHALVMAREAGPASLALGTDFNGFVPRVRGAGTSAGYARVLDALEAAGLRGVRESAESFVKLWRRCLGAPEAA